MKKTTYADCAKAICERLEPNKVYTIRQIVDFLCATFDIQENNARHHISKLTIYRFFRTSKTNGFKLAFTKLSQDTFERVVRSKGKDRTATSEEALETLILYLYASKYDEKTPIKLATIQSILSGHKYTVNYQAFLAYCKEQNIFDEVNTSSVLVRLEHVPKEHLFTEAPDTNFSKSAPQKGPIDKFIDAAVEMSEAIDNLRLRDVKTFEQFQHIRRCKELAESIIKSMDE